jgi:hypothetical protein
MRDREAVPLVKGTPQELIFRPGGPRSALKSQPHAGHQSEPDRTREIRISVTTENSASATAIRPFTIPKVPDSELQALRARIAATRWPDQETVTDDSQGVPLAMVQDLARYWAADYDCANNRAKAPANVSKQRRKDWCE